MDPGDPGHCSQAFGPGGCLPGGTAETQRNCTHTITVATGLLLGLLSVLPPSGPFS